MAFQEGEVEAPKSPTSAIYGEKPLELRVRQSLDLAINHSSQTVREDGHWCGELRSNATITAEYVFLLQALRLDLTSDRDALCQWLFSDQKVNGSWSIAPVDYPGDVSTSVEAYLALRILGISAKDPAMERAQNFIISAGGIEKVRIFTRIYLATFGLFPWDAVPELPAELILVSVFEFHNSLAVEISFLSFHKATFLLMCGLIMQISPDAGLGFHQHLQTRILGTQHYHTTPHYQPSQTHIFIAEW